MVRVLVLGATGFIGHDVALALSRNGHIVLGQTRSETSTRALQAAEIIPLVGDPADLTSLLEKHSNVDCVIDAVGGDTISTDIEKRIDAAIAFAKKARPHGPPLTFISTSGTWVHGDNRSERKTEGDVLTEPIKLTGWRVPLEHKLLAASGSVSFRGIIIRPSILYGKSASLFALLFATAKQGATIEWFGRPGGHVNTIHADDLGDLYARAVGRAHLLGGTVLDGGAYTESVDDLLAQLKQLTGAKDVRFKEPSNDFETALSTSQFLQPTLARDLLDWHPRKPSVVLGLPTYYAAWQASQQG